MKLHIYKQVHLASKNHDWVTKVSFFFFFFRRALGILDLIVPDAPLCLICRDSLIRCFRDCAWIFCLFSRTACRFLLRCKSLAGELESHNYLNSLVKINKSFYFIKAAAYLSRLSIHTGYTRCVTCARTQKEKGEAWPLWIDVALFDVLFATPIYSF